jgi:hypothetical protein
MMESLGGLRRRAVRGMRDMGGMGKQKCREFYPAFWIDGLSVWILRTEGAGVEKVFVAKTAIAESRWSRPRTWLAVV